MLPIKMGGMGIPRSAIVAMAAFSSSHESATRAHDRVSQAERMTLAYEALHEKMMNESPELARILAINALPGASGFLMATESRVNADQFAAALRTFLALSCNVTSRPCPGCKGEDLDPLAWDHHVIGCTRIARCNAASRHAMVKRGLSNVLRESGFQVPSSEPRDLHVYDCDCGKSFTHAEFALHKSRDRCILALGHKFDHSGPDLRITTPARDIIADVTIRNVYAQSYVSQSPAMAFAEMDKTKQAKYGDICSAAGYPLVTLSALSNGHLGPEVVSLIKEAALLSERDSAPLINRIAATVTLQSAAMRLAAERAVGASPPTQVFDTSLGPSSVETTPSAWSFASVADLAAAARSASAEPCPIRDACEFIETGAGESAYIPCKSRSCAARRSRTPSPAAVPPRQPDPATHAVDRSPTDLRTQHAAPPPTRRPSTPMPNEVRSPSRHAAPPQSIPTDPRTQHAAPPPTRLASPPPTRRPSTPMPNEARSPSRHAAPPQSISATQAAALRLLEDQFEAVRVAIHPRKETAATSIAAAIVLMARRHGHQRLSPAAWAFAASLYVPFQVLFDAGVLRHYQYGDWVVLSTCYHEQSLRSRAKRLLGDPTFPLYYALRAMDNVEPDSLRASQPYEYLVSALRRYSSSPNASVVSSTYLDLFPETASDGVRMFSSNTTTDVLMDALNRLAQAAVARRESARHDPTGE
jgi:hypothetical protein